MSRKYSLPGGGSFGEWAIPPLEEASRAFARWRHREHMFPSRMWRELYDALLSRQSGGRAEREYLGMLAWPRNTGWRISRRESCVSVWDAGLDAMRRELDAASEVVVVDFRADLSSYDTMIAAAGQEEVCHG